MLTYADAHVRLAAIQAHLAAGADGASETYADVCLRMLTYADVC